ncbi:MAG: 1-deoxy-D-xylulose-5-phosphate synthase [Oscillospiraceae bacterium]
MILEQIQSPADVKRLSQEECRVLCAELRQCLLENVSRTGGHLASNLGVVELTVAIHRVFDTATDRLVFDVGHQCYVHKLLTGRREQFSTLRQYGGLSGFPKPYESVHDAFIAGHASNSVSVALGMARARTLQKQDYQVLALIGDGALTGGLAYEGLNDAGQSGEPLILILNDNGMSISGNVGGMAEHLKKLRNKPGYYSFKKWYRSLFGQRAASSRLYQFNHSLKTSLKQALYPFSTLFEDIGFTYLGPVDGHDVEQLTNTLRWAKELRAPVVVHVNTVKGKGYPFAEQEPNLYHGVGPFDLRYGVPREGKRDFSAVFGETLSALAEEEPRLCAITAAMKEGTGLAAFAERYPERFFDVGIAEGHGVSLAAGLAKQGCVPVMAVYSTFLQRGFDELQHDVSLSRLHAVFAVDRAGLVGSDGETHHGVFDVGYLTAMPGMTVLAPASFQELRAMLRFAVLQCGGPVAVRYPRGAEGAWRGGWDGKDFTLLREGKDGVIVTYGMLVNNALAAAELLKERGRSVAVLKLNVLSPLDSEALSAALAPYGAVLAAEEAVAHSGVGERIAALLAQRSGFAQKLRLRNLGEKVPAQGSLQELQKELGLDAEGLASAMEEWLG